MSDLSFPSGNVACKKVSCSPAEGSTTAISARSMDGESESVADCAHCDSPASAADAVWGGEAKATEVAVRPRSTTPTDTAAPVAGGTQNVAPTPEPPALARIVGQPRVRAFLSAAVREGRLSHAYLFLGAPGSGQTEAAQALAECVVCPSGGCDNCDECIRVAHRTHPDVHRIAPEGAAGYVIDQVRALIADAQLAPVRAQAKVYVLERVEALRDASANALLKTIEEPPEGVVFILMARTADAVLPTIVSRCQCVPFRVSNPADAARRIALTCGISPDDPAARIALAVAGSPERACDYLRSPGRREARRLMVRSLDGLARDDDWDVLCAARDLVAAAKVPLDDVRASQEEAAEQSADYLSPKAQKLMEQRNKRELTARERSGMIELLAAAHSLLRDVLMRLEGVDAPIVNADAADVVDRLARATDATGALAALAAVSRASDDIAHNVSPQLALEVMLCSCKEALCPPSSR